MHIQNSIFPKVIPQMLSHSHHALQLSSIDHVSIREPSLWTIHTHRSSAKRSKMPLRPSMNLISLWHKCSHSSPKTENNGDGTGPTRNTVATIFQFASIQYKKRRKI